MSRYHPDPDRFNPLVWEIVRQVPRGVVTTFGQLASMIPAYDGADEADYAKLAPRYVGDAMNAVSFVDEPSVPWHRVINAKGGISLPEGSKAALQQRARLEAEGVVFDAKGNCDLNVYGWDGPDAEFLRELHLLTPRAIKKKRGDDSGQIPLF